MKEKPILFSTPMVQAILDNRKTMTRRTSGLEIVNEHPDQWIFNDKIKPAFSFFNKASGIIASSKIRYNVGDRIWVRETFFDTRKYRHALLFAFSPAFMYKADNVFIGEHKWKPSLFMPKEVARLWLECTNVKCERLHSITEADAIAEGIEKVNVNKPFEGYKEYFIKGFTTGVKPVHSFFSLWMSINGIESLQLNPWVFVYEFKRIEKP